MPGNKIGGLKAATKNLAKDPDYYKKLGHRGGIKGHTGGFYDKKECNCPEFSFTHTKPMCAGKRGGTKSRRTSKKVLTS